MFCCKEISVIVIYGNVIAGKALLSVTIIIHLLFYREPLGNRYNILLSCSIIVALCEMIRNSRYDPHKVLNSHDYCNSNSF